MRRALAAAVLCLAALPACAADARVRLVRVGSFNAPIYVAAPRGDSQRVFVVERGGRIMVLRNGHKFRRPFLDIRRKVSGGGERGLLSMAFAPDYASSGRFYVDYTDNSGDIRVVEYVRSSSPDRAAAGSARNVIRIEHSQFTNHNGGQIEIGPDGFLYIGVGDGGSEGDPNNTGQNLGTLLGKILRIDPRAGGGYGIPSGNPFSGGGRRAEIYAYGLRNPWRFSFDRSTGALAIGDVGQDKFAEIDFVPRGKGAGANFGWNAFEGRHRYKRGTAQASVAPVIERPHSDGFCAIVRGYVVRDRALRGLYGRYVYGDDCSPRIYSARLRAGRASDERVLMGRMQRVVSFGEDGLRRVYCVRLSGSVYRLGG